MLDKHIAKAHVPLGKGCPRAKGVADIRAETPVFAG
jgi:hypothetical protein